MEGFLKLHCKGKFCAIKKDFIVAIFPSGESTGIVIGDGLALMIAQETVYVDETSEEVWAMLHPEDNFEDEDNT